MPRRMPCPAPPHPASDLHCPLLLLCLVPPAVSLTLCVTPAESYRQAATELSQLLHGGGLDAPLEAILELHCKYGLLCRWVGLGTASAGQVPEPAIG